MKFFATTIFSFFILFHSAYSKSRLGEYYMGFGYAIADGGKNTNIEGDFLSVSANSPASDSADFILRFDYGSVDSNVAELSTWELGLDYIYHYDDSAFQNGLFRPFAGGGISYLSDDAKVRMNKDGSSWKLLAGTEVLFSDYFSVYLGANFIGLWSDFGQNDFSIDVGLTWWVNDFHGVAIEYNHALDQEVDFIGLKYLYSWQ